MKEYIKKINECAEKAGLSDVKELDFEHFQKRAKSLVDDAYKKYYEPVLYDKHKCKDDKTCREKLEEAIVVLQQAIIFDDLFGF